MVGSWLARFVGIVESKAMCMELVQIGADLDGFERGHLVFDRVVSGTLQAFWYIRCLCLAIGVLIGDLCDVPNVLRLVLIWVCHLDCVWVSLILFSTWRHVPRVLMFYV